LITRLGAGTLRVEPAARPLRGEWQPQGDRQMTHLALILGSLAIGPVHVLGSLESPDTVATRRVLAHLGVTFTTDEEGWLAISRREQHLSRPEVDLDCGRSGFALRLMLGLLAGQRFSSMLTGDEELLAQSVGHVATPLKAMGAQVECLGQGGRPPVRVKGQPLYPTAVTLDPAYPDVHDPLLLAALFAVGESRFTEPAPAPDHAERMLRHLGASVRRSGLSITLKGDQRIYPRRIKLPGDFSAAAPLIVAATLLPESELVVNEVGTNPGRTGLLKTLTRAGAVIDRQRSWQFGGEPVGSFTVHHAPGLAAFTIAPNLAPSALDEYFLLAVAATQADGISVMRGGAPLSRSTPDSLMLGAQMLQAFGADVEYDPDGLRVAGPCRLVGAEVQCASDPRLALLAILAGLIADTPSVLHGAAGLEDHYPGLVEVLNRLLEDDSSGFEADSVDA
jgi:3-phosphoshikimate 1-carboxyvinyltransferase